ncbi:hypothetical protein BDZ89DRAFT_934883, partial [Hymenopellis radicata]
RADEYLAELLRLEAPLALTTCPGVPGRPCQDVQGIYKCLTCHDHRLFCLECFSFKHAGLYLHRIQEWTGTHFWPTTLAKIGVVVQLGHAPGDDCFSPRFANAKRFVVIDVDQGLQVINLQYCGCTLNAGIGFDIQLLRARLYPATTHDPETCATFRALEHFQILSFMSKLSAYEYFAACCRLTDNTGTETPPNRYAQLLIMVREWRHLKFCKRFGRGNADGGRKQTQAGDLVVVCPACPQPGLNMHVKLPTDPDYVDRMFLAIDANFRLKRADVSSSERDPALNAGCAYFVEEETFDKYINLYEKVVPDEDSTCNKHDALKLASMRGGKGTASTGVGAVVCARHDTKRGSAVVNLKKGEKYIYMDYAFLSTLRLNTPDDLVISYDIACQWSKKLTKRIAVYPPWLHPRQSMEHMLYLVPKFHLPAHIPFCRFLYSFNWTPKVGRTEGEAPERSWSANNGSATSTREMGPGSRRDTLDDHFGDQNWRKVCLMMPALVEKLEEAVKERATHVVAFLGYEASLADANIIPIWREAVLKWEADPRAKGVFNPFTPTFRELRDNSVRLKLAEADAKYNDDTFPRHSVGPGDFIIQGLQLEDWQIRLKRDASKLGQHATDNQKANLLEKVNRLKRRIEAWREVQSVYMPAATVIRHIWDVQAAPGHETAYDMKLLLPSAIGRVRCTLDQALFSAEKKLRIARAEDALGQLRELIILKSSMYRVKERQIRGQKRSGRANTQLKQVEDRIRECRDRYNRHYDKLCLLDKLFLNHDWKKSMKPLTEADCVAPGDSDGSEGHRTFSWIWLADIHVSDDARVQEGEPSRYFSSSSLTASSALRIEWCKSRARAKRWQEECNILRVEMRRVLATFEAQAAVW